MRVHVQAVKIRLGHGYPLGIPPLSVNQLIPRIVQERLVAASKRLGSLYGRGRVVSRTRQGWHAPPLANSKWGVFGSISFPPRLPLASQHHRQCPSPPPVPPRASAPRLVTALPARRPRRQSLTDKCYPVTRGRGERWLSGLVEKNHYTAQPFPSIFSVSFRSIFRKLNRKLNGNFSNFFLFFFINLDTKDFKFKWNNFLTH